MRTETEIAHPALKPETVYQDAYVRIDLDTTVKFIYVEWLQHPDSITFRERFRKAVALTIEHGCHYWLSDARAIHYLEFADQNWMLEHILPLAPQTRLLKFARIATMESIALMDVARIYDTLKELQAANMQTRYEIFTTKETALDWLLREV